MSSRVSTSSTSSEFIRTMRPPMRPGGQRRSRPSTMPTCATSSSTCTGCSIPMPASASSDRPGEPSMKLVKRLTRSPAFQKTVGVVAAEYLRLVFKTNRTVIDPPDIYERIAADLPIIVAMWHGHHFMMPFFKRPEHSVKVLISRHRDGEVNAIVAERLGIGTIRGSGAHDGRYNEKGGVAAFRDLMAALAQGHSVALTADIPKVSRVAGAGIVMLARK